MFLVQDMVHLYRTRTAQPNKRGVWRRRDLHSITASGAAAKCSDGGLQQPE
jgi:hypothetical protein